MGDDPGVLDPNDARPAVAAALREWLAFQAEMALRPGDAAELLRRDRSGALRAALAGGRSVESAVLALRRAGAVALPPGAPAHPTALSELADPPALLLVRGDVEVLRAPCVAIVGARAATVYGRATAERFAAALARAGVVVVSGLATGIDGTAHVAALEAGGRSVAVLACGPDRVYPAAHRSLAERIARQGAVVTEMPPGTPPLPAYFPLRNRLISALSDAVLVVEARERSGSLITAGHAATQGVDVFAVPGPLTAPSSAGTNRLLRDGAFVALDPDEILARLRASGALPNSPAKRDSADPKGPRAPHQTPALENTEQQRIVASLREEPLTRDELGRRLSRSPARLALDLFELELSGRVATDRDGRLRVTTAG